MDWLNLLNAVSLSIFGETPAQAGSGNAIPSDNVVAPSEDNNGSEYVTAEQFKTMNDVWVKQMTQIEETIVSLRDTLKTAQNPAEKKEAAEKQLADAQRIHEEKKATFEPSMLGGLETVGGSNVKIDTNFLTKHVRPGMPKEVVKNYIERAISCETEDEALKEFQDYCDYIKIACGCTGKRPSELSIYPEYDYLIEKSGLKDVISVVDSPANWIPEGWSSELLTYYMQELMVAQLWLPSFEMPQDPFRWDFVGTGITIYRRSEPTTDPASKYRSSSHSQSVITFATEELAARLVVTRKLTEDALAAYMPTLRTQLIPRAMAEALESALVNGHGTTAANHFDTIVTDDDDVKTSWDGIRRWAAAESAEYNVQADSSAFAYVDFNSVMLTAGKFAIRLREGVWVMSNAAYIKSLSFDEVETSDKINLPTNINGVVNVIYGRPVMVSPEYPQTMDSNGRDTGAGTLTGFAYVNRDQFKLAHRRDDTIEQARNIATGQNEIVITSRRDFQGMLPSGNTLVATGINVPTS